MAQPAGNKLKKDGAGSMPGLELVENPDILTTLSQPGPRRPGLVIGFAAETEQVIDHATDKLRRKGCDWILANDVSASQGVFGGNDNTVHLVTADQVEDWPRMAKAEVAERLVRRIADHRAA